MHGVAGGTPLDMDSAPFVFHTAEKLEGNNAVASTTGTLASG